MLIPHINLKNYETSQAKTFSKFPKRVRWLFETAPGELVTFGTLFSISAMRTNKMYYLISIYFNK
jgi:hypothetical protein